MLTAHSITQLIPISQVQLGMPSTPPHDTQQRRPRGRQPATEASQSLVPFVTQSRLSAGAARCCTGYLSCADVNIVCGPIIRWHYVVFVATYAGLPHGCMGWARYHMQGNIEPGPKRMAVPHLDDAAAHDDDIAAPLAQHRFWRVVLLPQRIATSLRRTVTCFIEAKGQHNTLCRSDDAYSSQLLAPLRPCS
jgi:hypothetical protein